MPLEATHRLPITQAQFLYGSRIEVPTATEEPISIQSHHKTAEIELLRKDFLRRVQRKIAAHHAAVRVQGAIAPRLANHDPLQPIARIDLGHRLSSSLGQPLEPAVSGRDVEVLRGHPHRHHTRSRSVDLRAGPCLQAPSHHTMVKGPAENVVGGCRDALNPTVLSSTVDVGGRRRASGQISSAHSSVQTPRAEFQEAEATDQFSFTVQ
mmetsp:Transcript_18104/g.43466  ORF Transcript_18104/g.43466 Transcript_18104/m.43466 type:complete len:209 (-) Transcript_18104:295-921(-)